MRFLLICFLTLMAGQTHASLTADVPASCGFESTIMGGDGNPWPWGRETIFPWLSIQGVWVPMEGDCNSLFVFRAKNIQVQNRVVQIVQYDPRTCEKIAWGVGVESERVVRAAMINKQGKGFDLSIRAFDDPAAPGALSISARNVVVLSMYPKGSWERRTSYQMQRVTAVPTMLCESKIPAF